MAARRPLKSRQSRLLRALAARLAALGVSPNAVSLASLVFAASAAAAFAFSLRDDGTTSGLLLLAAAAAIQLRLLCNLVDGLIAVEGGRRSAVGELYNEVPDRIADPLILVGAGLALRATPGGMTVAWLTALVALFTAYVRVLGGSLGLPQSFAGPMAKQHRMFVLTLGCVASAVESASGRPPRLLAAAIGVVFAGSVLTAIRRLSAIARELRTR